jgi:ribosomal-protein-alanine N-acetyltransferase
MSATSTPTERLNQPRLAAYVQIAPMTLEDIPAVMAIERAVFPRPWPERAYRYELTENPNARFVVARLPAPAAPPAPVSPWRRLASRLGLVVAAPNNRPMVVGFAGMWLQVDEAHIATIATHPDWRGRGIGQRTLLALLREAQRCQVQTVTLEVRVSNLIAQRLYQKYGFREVGRRRAYYQDNREDALLMTITDFATPDYRARLDALAAALLQDAAPPA